MYHTYIEGGVMDILHIWKWAIFPILLAIIITFGMLFAPTNTQQNESFVGKVIFTVLFLFILMFLWCMAWLWRGLMYT